LSRFFIDRPIFATAIAILMVLVGAIAIKTLPISQYPEIVPPTVSVNAGYAGASADVTARVVTTPLEQQINGVEGMLYMSSNSTASGASSITVTFEVGYDVDVAAVDIQNRVSTAQASLPEVTQRSGVVVRKQSSNLTMVVNLKDTSGNYDSAFLGNWAEIYMVDALLRNAGIGQVVNFGLLKYSVRVWLDPSKLSSFGVSTTDVANAINAQNTDFAIGQIGTDPLPQDVAFRYQLSAVGQLREIEAFNDIVVKTGSDGSLVMLRDIGTVELGAEDYGTTSRLNNHPTATLGIMQNPGSNALEVSEAVEAFLAEIEPQLPPGVEAQVTYDTTAFVRASMEELVLTLLEAVGLVILVVFVFLQSWRTVLIPMIAIPVSLIATFAAMAAFGFSINTLTLLGLVLAVGIVVDDAIVVVENVERQLQNGLSRRAAALQAMKEVKSPIIATTIVLMAVFVPTAFMPGITGQLYNQFALTIAISVAFSSFNSLTLTPALAAIFLKYTPREERIAPFRAFNRAFDAIANAYASAVHLMSTKLWWVVLLVFAGLLGLTWNRLENTPIGFVPAEDQGWFFTYIELPSGASLSRTEAITEEVTAILSKNPAVANCMTISGYSFLNGVSESNAGVVFVILKPWEERTAPESKIPALLDVIKADLFAVKGTIAVPINPPPIPGLGSTGGFEFQIQDFESKGPVALEAMTQKFIAKAMARDSIGNLLTEFSVDHPVIDLDINRLEAERLGVPIQNVYQTLSAYFGSYYVNNWNKFNQVYRVIVQADGSHRLSPENVTGVHVANRTGQQIPLEQLVNLSYTDGPYNIPHYNLYNSAKVIGGPAKGYSGGEAVREIMEVADEVLTPEGYTYAWTGTVYQQIIAGNLAPFIFGLSLITVFLVLCALYESWTLPFVILLCVPLAVLGALIGLNLRDLNLDIYGQIGLLMLVGLAAKNAILIVEFAKTLRESGSSIIDAAVEASRLRIRPILMTAFAFILGVFPLVIASGAGAAARNSIGTVVFGGMLASTFLSLVIVPVLYVVIEFAREKVIGKKASENLTEIITDRNAED
jgi:hydrophobe/amphiphile efflux-1 (HAE1) family protein